MQPEINHWKKQAQARRVDTFERASGRPSAKAIKAKEDRLYRQKRAQRLMRLMGIQSVAPRPNTSRPHPRHKVYPYLLANVPIVRPGQVYSTDITYIRIGRGYAYLVAVVDWCSRKVLSWRLSNTMDTGFCVAALEEALWVEGPPKIFNTDQGSQFTSEVFTKVLKDYNVRISMDGKGRALDNLFVERLWRSVNYEEVYIKQYQSMPEARAGLAAYFNFYNTQRPHQALSYQIPAEVHADFTQLPKTA